MSNRATKHDFSVVWEVLKHRSGAVGTPRRGPEVRWMGRRWACEPVVAMSRGGRDKTGHTEK